MERRSACSSRPVRSPPAPNVPPTTLTLSGSARVLICPNSSGARMRHHTWHCRAPLRHRRPRRASGAPLRRWGHRGPAAVRRRSLPRLRNRGGFSAAGGGEWRRAPRYTGFAVASRRFATQRKVWRHYVPLPHRSSPRTFTSFRPVLAAGMAASSHTQTGLATRCSAHPPPRRRRWTRSRSAKVPHQPVPSTLPSTFPLSSPRC